MSPLAEVVGHRQQVEEGAIAAAPLPSVVFCLRLADRVRQWAHLRRQAHPEPGGLVSAAKFSSRAVLGVLGVTPQLVLAVAVALRANLATVALVALALEAAGAEVELPGMLAPLVPLVGPEVEVEAAQALELAALAAWMFPGSMQQRTPPGQKIPLTL